MKRFIGINYLHEDGTTSAGMICMDDVARIIATDDGYTKVYYTCGQCDTLTCSYKDFNEYLQRRNIIEVTVSIV